MSVAIQKTDGWHAARVGRVTGSRVGAILGNNPHQKREDVMREMVRDALGLEREFTGNEATRHGEKNEPFARAWYEAHHKVSVEETGLVVHPKHDWVAVSPDGLVGFDGGIEIKTPFYSRVPYSVHDKNKRMYLDQCRLVTEVCGLAWIDFVCWISDDEVHVDRIHHDPLWFGSVFHTLEEFINEYREIMANPERQKPFIKPKKKNEYVEVSDPDMDRLAVLHKQISLLDQQLVPLRKEFDELKVRLFERHSYCHNGQVRVGCVERKGAVDYPRLIKELKIDPSVPDQFRKASTFVYSVEEFK